MQPAVVAVCRSWCVRESAITVDVGRAVVVGGGCLFISSVELCECASASRASMVVFCRGGFLVSLPPGAPSSIALERSNQKAIFKLLKTLHLVWAGLRSPTPASFDEAYYDTMSRMPPPAALSSRAASAASRHPL